MSKKSYLIAAAVALAGCAGGQKEQTGTPETQKQQVEENVVPFDLYNCFPRKVDVPSPVNEAGLTAVWVVAQPRVSECLVDPAARGPALNTDVSVTLTDTEQGANVEVTGQNLTPQGADCIKQAVLQSGNIPPLAAGAQPVSRKLQIAHEIGKSPALQKGQNEISDLAIPIRLAERNMCECFQSWKEAPPTSFLANIDVKKGAGAAASGQQQGQQAQGQAQQGQQAQGQGGTPATVTVSFAPYKPATAPSAQAAQPAATPDQQQAAQPAQPAAPAAQLDPTTQQVASCIQPKIQALNLQPTSDEVKFQLPFYFMNTGANVAVKDAPNQVRFFQLDGLRSQRAADAAIAVAKRAEAVQNYDKMVKSYNASKKTLKGQKLMDTLKELSTNCQAMVTADDNWKNAAQARLDVDQRTLQLAQELAAQDQKWGAAVKAAQGQIDGDQKEVTAVTQQRGKDEKICPKLKY